MTGVGATATSCMVNGHVGFQEAAVQLLRPICGANLPSAHYELRAWYESNPPIRTSLPPITACTAGRSFEVSIFRLGVRPELLREGEIDEKGPTSFIGRLPRWRRLLHLLEKKQM
jgi:hypothetical protein